ncbi:hypothetical protein M0802_001465 [Mischocyttarus mexicanus]|nr:hypothetical protein M0802_001465 [Mischocyttarus mexicanus]
MSNAYKRNKEEDGVSEAMVVARANRFFDRMDAVLLAYEEEEDEEEDEDEDEDEDDEDENDGEEEKTQ